jgi:hypothetical protein
MNVQFKSTPLNFRNEFLGLKRNTVRDIEVGDLRREILDKFHNGIYTDVKIYITNTETKEEFFRQITNVTKFNGLYIISW